MPTIDSGTFPHRHNKWYAVENLGDCTYAVHPELFDSYQECREHFSARANDLKRAGGVMSYHLYDGCSNRNIYDR